MTSPDLYQDPARWRRRRAEMLQAADRQGWLCAVCLIAMADPQACKSKCTFYYRGGSPTDCLELSSNLYRLHVAHIGRAPRAIDPNPHAAPIDLGEGVVSAAHLWCIFSTNGRRGQLPLTSALPAKEA